MEKLPFIPDQIYKRSDIHDQYGGNRQGGISPSAKFPFIFIFSGKSGEQYGYKDGWDNPNIFSYTGELIIGDSHEYGPTHDPFDKNDVNQLILDYLYGFGIFPDKTIAATWNGTYAKLKNGGTELILNPIPGVTIVNGLGGAGMTLSFGLADQLINQSFIS